MKKKVYKIAIIIVILILSFCGLKILLVWGWEKGRRYSFNKKIKEENKVIIFENKLDSAIYIYINFKYTDLDSIDFYQKRIDTTFFLDGIDPLYLRKLGSTDSIFYSEIPLFVNDSTHFPKEFNVKIYNQYNNLLKVVDYKLFMKYAKPQFYMNEHNPLTAIEWTLVIDSTLLGLDKLKIDYIR